MPIDMFKRKKSLRERLQSNDQASEPDMMASPAETQSDNANTGERWYYDKEGDAKNLQAWKDIGNAINPFKSAEPKQTSPSPQQQPEQPDEADQKSANFLQNSQTMDGPEKGAVKPEDVPSPDEFNRFYRKWRSVPTELGPADKKMFTDRLHDLDQKMMDAEETYKQDKNRMMWAEAAESLGQAVIQLFAAQDAAKNNWSMNGMKFDKNNWEAKYDRALREYDSHKDTIAKQQSAINSELTRAESKQERSGTKEQSLLARDFFTTQAKIEADSRRKAKEDERGTKDAAAKEIAARKLARSYIKNYSDAEALVGRLESGNYKDEKEKAKIQDDIAKAMGANGHMTASKDIKTGEGKITKTGGFWGFFKSDDFAPMKKYIQTNKKKGIESVYRGYGIAVPSDVEQALSETEIAATEPSASPAAPVSGPAKPAVAAPAVGTIQGGYRFKGGDPKDKNSWEPVK